MALSKKNPGRRANNEHYACIFRFFPEAVSLTRSSDGVLLDVNEAFEQLTGYLRGEVVGRRTAQLGCWLDPDKWEEVSRQLEANGEVRDLDTRIMCKDGRFAFILMTLRRLEIEGEQCYLAVVRDISEHKQAEERGKEREEELQAKLDTLLSPDEDISGEEVRRIIDFQQTQEMMNSFYKVTKISIGLLDLKGNILAATGYQDLCAKFHRLHPQTLANCIESDVYLSQEGLEEENCKIYKCRNNMWDIATQITVAGKHIANLFLGQFFFEDEVPDRETFTRQAEAYGFDKDEYLAALDRIPRWSRETIHNVMEFYSHLARMVAKLSYRNIRLAKALVERKRAEEALRESKETFAKAFHTAPISMAISTIEEGSFLEVSEAFERLTGYTRDEAVGRTAPELGLWHDPLERRELVALLEKDGEVRDREFTLRGRNGEFRAGLFSGVVINLHGEKRLLSLVSDITQRKRVEEALRESEEKFAKAFRATPSVLSISTIAEGRYIEVNEAFVRVTGYLREEAIGRSSLELNIWETPEVRTRFLLELREKGKVRDLEARFRNKNGGLVEGLLSAEIIEIKGEQCLLILVNDITARKLAEESLKVSEAEKSLILNSTIDLVIYHDVDMKVVWGNQKALDSVGMLLEEMVGRYCWEIWHQRSEACPGCPVVLARDTGAPQEAEIRSPDGREWYIRGFPVKNDDGRVKGVVEFCLEITERKRAEYALLESERLLESEKRFRSLFEHMLEGVAYCKMLFDENGSPVDFVYLDVNRAYSELFGLHDLVGKRVGELVPGIRESAPELFEVYGRVASTGRPEKCEIYIKQLSLWRSMSVYSTEKGYFVAVSENITERKRFEAELRESHHKLRKLTAHLNLTRERGRKAFARKVHDELGTSLTLLKFDLAWLKRNYPPDDKTVAERIKAMDELIHECTKTIQRITSELRPSLLDEQGLAAAIEWQAKEFENRSGISCTLEIDAATPPLSQDKSINVYRIFQESLSNVMRHAGATCVAVSLAKAGQKLVLRITDNGVGISDHEISSATSFGILGMEERARLCDGNIIIKGSPGRGTTISVSIPTCEG